MPYLERYLAGEREGVWDELCALGPAVFGEPLYTDAVAVARELMRRVRHNIEHLIPRLIEIGYVFGYDHLIRDTLLMAPTQRDWVGYAALLQWVREQPPIFLPARFDEEQRAQLDAFGIGERADDEGESGSAAPDMGANVQELDRRVGPLPLSLRLWYEQVGAVNFFGFHPRWVEYVDLPADLRHLWPRYLMGQCDPLQVCALDNPRMEKFQRGGGHPGLEFAEDRHFKNYTGGTSSPYLVYFEPPGVDGQLPGSPTTTFVRYLRTAFEWAGFPGMAEWRIVPTEDLAFLTEGLLPF